ncbi:MAG: hypothetical protein LBK73_15830 [Treponema sp.]|jgi:hypothetical protein|nr:hypothetical protein [Treponema sp.]
MDVSFTPGSVHDSHAASGTTEGLKGIFAGDAEYLQKEKVFRELYNSNFGLGVIEQNGFTQKSAVLAMREKLRGGGGGKVRHAALK